MLVGAKRSTTNIFDSPHNELKVATMEHVGEVSEKLREQQEPRSFEFVKRKKRPIESSSPSLDLPIRRCK